MRQISGPEMEVLQAVRRFGGPVTSARVPDSPAARSRKAATGLTLLARLCEKDLLRVERRGKSGLYSPCPSEGESRRRKPKSRRPPGRGFPRRV